MSGFNYAEFESHFGDSSDRRKDLVYMARTAEAAERYEDMCKFMKELVNHLHPSGGALTVEERNLLSVAYKNVIGARRASWRTLPVDDEQELMAVYKSQLEAELNLICSEVLGLLEKKLIAGMAEDDEADVFYHKMAADYYRYLAECVQDQGHADKAVDFYAKAFAKADENLKSTHPIRLGLALNYSVCLYEIKKDSKHACELAKTAFDNAISELDKLEEADYKDSTLIMQLLRDNLTLWTSGEAEDDDEN